MTAGPCIEIYLHLASLRELVRIVYSICFREVSPGPILFIESGGGGPLLSSSRIILSLFVVLHLVGVAIVPNMSSYSAQRVAPFYMQYMHGLGLGGIWSFFAPEPFSPPMYLDYTLEIPNDIPITGRFPDDSEEFFWRSQINRRTSISRFMMSDSIHVEHMFMNYLCHRYPNANSAKIWSVRGTQPDFNMVRNQGKSISKTVDYKSEFVGEFTCARSERNAE